MFSIAGSVEPEKFEVYSIPACDLGSPEILLGSDIKPALFLKMFGNPATNPMGWDIINLSDVAINFRYGTSARCNNDKNEGLPVLRIPNILKSENEETLPHDRYLITDQFAIAIGRGFDLFWSDKQMKDAGLDPNRDARPVRDVTWQN